MKAIEMPVYRPTAPCIWNSFLNSGKRHLIITGNRKSGKTTLLNEFFPNAHSGITTWAEPKKAVYLRENLTESSVLIGTYDDSLPGPENKMVPCADGFHSLGIPALKRCIQQESEWITIDEIGYLETAVPDFQISILQLMENKRLVAIVRKQSLPFLQKIFNRNDVFIVDMDNLFGSNGCVIMASGMSRRFGSNKLMTDFMGQPLINQVLKATDNIFTRRVVVTRHETVAALCRQKNIDVVLHDLPHRSDTVRLGLEALGDVDSCMFCPADQPLLHHETIAALALASRNNKTAILRPVYEGNPGSPVIFPKWTFPELMNLPVGSGGGHIIKKHPEQVCTIPVRDAKELRDVDLPEDLIALMER